LEWVDSRWILAGPRGKVWEGTISVRLYSGVELDELLKRAGFSAIQLYGNFSGTPYDQNADQLMRLQPSDPRRGADLKMIQVELRSMTADCL
jgi:hypothetical protein